MDNAKSIKPLPGYVVLEPVETKTTSGGLALPDSQQEQNQRGKILEIGKEYKNENGVTIWPIDLSVGMVVLYRKYSEQEVEIDFKKYIIAKFSDLVGEIL